MDKICFEILNKWAEYAEYDEKQTSFNLGNWSYQIHNITKSVKHIIDDYDDSGFLAVLLVKQLFFKILKDSKSNLYDVFSKPQAFENHRKMYELFSSDAIEDAERKYTDKLYSLLCDVFGSKLIGEFDKDVFHEEVLNRTSSVIRSLDKCKMEFYQIGGEFQEIVNYSTSINVFPSLADCVLTLSQEQVHDGIYLCFIDVCHSADSYFGIFIKNNSNILSFHDRNNEAYKGQHMNSRNARWSENKADEIFPYEYIFNYKDFDYKGYSHTYEIDKNKLTFSEMGEEAFLPMLLAMVLAVQRIKNIDVKNQHPVYMDSLLHVNLPLLEKNGNSLSVIKDNAVIQRINTLNLDFDYNSIMDGSGLDEFKWDRKSTETSIFSQNNGQIFVDLYGEGFEIPSDIFSTQKYLMDKEREYVPEFIGSERRMRAQVYFEIRKQLADYIRKNMYKEYQSFGGISAVVDWYMDVIQKNLDTLKELMVQYYVDVKTGKKKNITGGWYPTQCEEKYFISLEENNKEPGYYRTINYDISHVINEYNGSAYLDMDTNTECSIFFIFQFVDYTGLEKLFGEVPKIVKGWTHETRRSSGNSILSMTDAVEEINTPFDSYCSRRPEYKDDDFGTYETFNFAVGFSKSGFMSLCKKYGISKRKIDKTARERRKQKNKDSLKTE